MEHPPGIDRVDHASEHGRWTLWRKRPPVHLQPRLLRFETALAALRSGTVSSLADLAYACGYADQSHLNGEFRSMSGQSPTALLRASLPDGGIIATPR